MAMGKAVLEAKEVGAIRYQLLQMRVRLAHLEPQTEGNEAVTQEYQKLSEVEESLTRTFLERMVLRTLVNERPAAIA